ncbi:hypothetical protein COU97_01145 [Candidatus Shapirobacteria bacterium CG10_big_fil_rev_8_21_14_0_10_48_15]|uniref:HD/PDEase domain-containing protein n=1 Tax=Candidatus Shapirobacteria bacterium CG10_big_fil_rev_8_21_14_0_10_48_15 TaxID=1974484 RepID=A0A2M8L7F2_9BACT|nr:MAG: hypothetical protein COU97_01145 [Candidatus Shapirobacteria bacterium CG10_big_fil_rev_8_21_14_0_10_48_15]
MVEKETSFLEPHPNLSPERRNQILAAVGLGARRIFDQMPLLPVHDITHVERVVKNTRAICQGEGIDSFIPEVAAWLHDIGRLQEIQAQADGKKIYHAEESAKQVPAILEPFKPELGEETIIAVQDAVARHSLPNAENDSQLVKILKDADKLDGLGSIGFFRVFAFYPERPIYNPQNPFEDGSTSEEYLRYSGQSSQVQAFLRNMEWFSDPRFWIVTPTAARLAVPRVKLMVDFLYQLADELGVPQGEVSKIPIVQASQKRLASLSS